MQRLLSLVIKMFVKELVSLYTDAISKPQSNIKLSDEMTLFCPVLAYLAGNPELIRLNEYIDNDIPSVNEIPKIFDEFISKIVSEENACLETEGWIENERCFWSSSYCKPVNGKAFDGEFYLAVQEAQKDVTNLSVDERAEWFLKTKLNVFYYQLGEAFWSNVHIGCFVDNLLYSTLLGKSVVQEDERIVYHLTPCHLCSDLFVFRTPGDMMQHMRHTHAGLLQLCEGTSLVDSVSSHYLEEENATKCLLPRLPFLRLYLSAWDELPQLLMRGAAQERILVHTFNCFIRDPSSAVPGLEPVECLILRHSGLFSKFISMLNILVGNSSPNPPLSWNASKVLLPNNWLPGQDEDHENA